MARRHLIIEQPAKGTRKKPRRLHITVQEHTQIEAVITDLIARFGYPLADSSGTPVLYHLRSLETNLLLPQTGTFLDADFPSGHRFVLEAQAAHTTTIPITPRSPLADRASTGKRVSRRSLLQTAVPISIASLLGIGSGMTAALAQHVFTKPVAKTPLRKVTGPFKPTLTLQTIFGQHQQRVRTVSWSPHGDVLASGGDDAQIVIWQPDGTVLHTLHLNNPVRSLAWSPDAMQLALGSGTTLTFVDTRTGQILFANGNRHVAPVTAVGWSQTTIPLAISASEDSRAIVWDGRTRQPRLIFQKHAASIEAITTLDQTVATTSLGGVVRVWTAVDGEENHAPFFDSTQSLRAASFSSSGLLAVGVDDGNVLLWQYGRFCTQQVPSQTGMLCADIPNHLQKHTAPVRAVAFSPNGAFLATGGDDGNLIIWSVNTRAPLMIEPLHKAITAVSWSPSRQFLAVAADQRVMIWQFHH